MSMPIQLDGSGQRMRLATKEGEVVSFDIQLPWYARLMVLLTGRIHVRFVPHDKTIIGAKHCPSSDVSITHYVDRDDLH